MKKGEEYVGVVVRTDFPNKGIVELEENIRDDHFIYN